MVAPTTKTSQNFKLTYLKGYEFKDRLQEKMFYNMFTQAIENGEYKTQEELDRAITKRLMGGGPKDPKDPGGPIMHDPEEPGLEAPIKGGGEFEAVPVKGGGEFEASSKVAKK